jgi:hypothetical protein
VLQCREDGDSCVMPNARYTLSKEKRKAFCDFLSKIIFPDGFASNISRSPINRETRSKKSKTQIDAILSPPSRDNDDTQAVVEG